MRQVPFPKVDCFTNAMKFFYLVSFIIVISFGASCRKAAAPVTISNSPTSVNGIPMSSAPLPPSKPIPQMSWTKFDGFEQNVGDLKGKAIILDFWATYCPPCLEEIPHLKELQAKHGKENLEIIGLHVGGDEDRPKVPAFVEKLGIDYTLGVPEDALVSFIFGGESAIPQTAIFDRNGKLIQKFVGFNDEIRAKLDAAVAEAVASAK